jgi:predicted DNA-binding ribbon-helix-helix protein
MSSFGDDDDEDEKKAKAIDALNSISEYEKGNYHIVFTGKKNKDGEYEYKRIKKLPVLSMVSTLTEQMVYKYLLSNDKRPYAFDSKAMKQAAEKSIPFSLSDIFSRNPLASAFITYYFNEDTFTGEEIFRQPRDKKIDPTAEGIYDDKVEEFYKQIAPALGLSPIRSKAFIEKIVTSENKKTGLGEEFSGAIDRVFESAGKKITRYTNKDIIMYNEMDKAEAEEMRIETDIYKKEQKMYSEIKSIYKDGKKMSVGQLIDKVKENFPKEDWENYAEKYYTYIQNMNVDRSVLDILYEKTPDVQALKLFNRYGSTLDDEEIKEISSTMQTANKKISDRAFLIYKNKYQRGK